MITMGLWLRASRSALLALPLLLTGCVGIETHHHLQSSSRGVGLSDAMQASASGNSAPIAGNSAGGNHSLHFHPSDDSGYVAASVGGGAALARSDSADSPEGIAVELSAEQIVPFENYIRSISRVAVQLGGENEFNYLGISFGLGTVAFRDHSLPDLAVSEAWIADLGVNYRRYLTAPHTFLRPYAATGFYAQGMHWRYRTAVNVGGDIIKSDGIGGGGGYVGGGLTLKAVDVLNFFAEARIGETIFASETSEGFRNNVLDNFGYYSFTVGASLKF